MWFEELTGFREESPEQVRERLNVDGVVLKSLVNGREMICGQLETPSLAELRERVRSVRNDGGALVVREVVADVRKLHADSSLAGSLFQVASQFNLLEMLGPKYTPELGVGIYEQDLTQGPACAISAGAGTIYRNYFAEVNGRMGQTANSQIDCLADLGTALGNMGSRLWEMKNGYALATEEGLIEISGRIRTASEAEVDDLRKLLRIGIQSDTQVTLAGCRHTVSQAYCSALPVSYSGHRKSLWAEFARLVLEASYEAAICAAILNSRATGNNKAFFTLVGGGAFGNPDEWIFAAIRRAVKLYEDFDLNVVIVSYGRSRGEVRQFAESLS